MKESKTYCRVRRGKIWFSVRERQDFFWRNFIRGEWEVGMLAVFDHYVREDSVVCDCGAWVGPATLYTATLARKVYAIEPDPVAFAELGDNVTANPDFAGKVRIFSVCLSDKTGKVRLFSDGDLGNTKSSLLSKSQGAAVEVPARSFQDLSHDVPFSEVSFIKMDIEGAETIVLPAMTDYFRRTKPTLFLSIHGSLFDSAERAFGVIRPVLEVYPFIYDNDGRTLTARDVEQRIQQRQVFDVLASTRPWPLWSRAVIFLSRYKMIRKLRWLWGRSLGFRKLECAS